MTRQREPGQRVRAVAVVAGLGVMALVLNGVQTDRDNLADEVNNQDETLDEFAQAVATLSGQVEALGGEPAVEVEDDGTGPEPVEVPGPPGPQGPAPSAADVQAAVARYCDTNGCVGPQGPAPTAVQVAAAVSAYCDDRGQCRGTAGTSGVDGSNGAAGSDGQDGPAGPAGPGPSDDQVAAAVATYCAAHDDCRGPAGPEGAQGPTGDPGAQGPPPESWTFTWLGTTWACTDPDGDLAYECSST